MGLSNAKEEQLKKQPILEAYVRKSEDGRFIVTKTVITTIKPVQYFQAIIDNDGVQSVEEEA